MKPFHELIRDVEQRWINKRKNMIIKGLHTCKPQNAPRVGEVKNFIVIDMGNWTKIKSRSPEEGGGQYTIVSVAKTDYVDTKYGNVSFNLEIEPATAGSQPASSGAGDKQEHQTLRAPVTAAHFQDDRSSRIERQHSQEMCLRFFALRGVTAPTTEQMRKMTSWFQRDISTSPVAREKSTEEVGGPMSELEYCDYEDQQ